ncbi:hypothetical protein CRE_07620 [Caenorhabditis remanei]|uniref:Uncharacterized protein n=1 Tax=Caenorhabditis remanei TaxID=31234 RepID=E3MP97_CAERE|nr:hypothetical protein CRE_07620 [Caenorhabditis remanei]
MKEDNTKPARQDFLFLCVFLYAPPLYEQEKKKPSQFSNVAVGELLVSWVCLWFWRDVVPNVRRREERMEALRRRQELNAFLRLANRNFHRRVKELHLPVSLRHYVKSLEYQVNLEPKK